MPPATVMIESVRAVRLLALYQPWYVIYIYVVTICFSHPSPISAWRFPWSRPSEMRLDRASALWMNSASFCYIWRWHFLVRRVGIKALVVVGNEAWDWANPEYLSISFLVAFRNFFQNELTSLPAGIFDSLASLTLLYVLWLVAETSFVSFLLEPDIFFFFIARFNPARCSYIEPLLYGWIPALFA